jgi:chromosome segregation ATPase
MIQQFERLENAISKLEKTIDDIKHENEKLLHEVEELKSVIEDRDLEILQLQEDAQKKTAENDSEKTEIENRIEGLLGRIHAISPEE